MEDIKTIKIILNGTVHISMEKLYVELTNRCNLKCIHCYNESNSGYSQDLSIEIVRGLIDAAYKCGLQEIALSGGEALLYPWIEDVLTYCTEKGLKPFILTNGTYCVDSKYYDILMKYEPDIQISLDGPDRQSNDMIRGEKSFDKTINFIQELKKSEYKGEISVNTVITEYTVNNYPEMVELCKKMNIDKLSYSMLTLAGRAQDHMLQLNNKDFIEIIRDINTNIKVLPENKCQGIGLNHECSLKKIQNGVIELQPKVTCYGEVFPCQMHNKKEYSIGNIYEKNIENILNSDQAKRFLTLMYLRNSFMQKCTSCIFEKMCKRGCMAKAVNDTKNPFETDGCCLFYKETFVQELKHLHMKYQET